jgi:hypothetical protein
VRYTLEVRLDKFVTPALWCLNNRGAPAFGLVLDPGLNCSAAPRNRSRMTEYLGYRAVVLRTAGATLCNVVRGDNPGNFTLDELGAAVETWIAAIARAGRTRP